MSELVAITVTHVVHSALGRGERTACGIRITPRWLVASFADLAQSHGGLRRCVRCQGMARDVSGVVDDVLEHPEDRGNGGEFE